MWIDDNAEFGGAFHRGVGRLLRDLVDQALRVLVAPRLQGVDRRKPILGRRAVARDQDGGAGEPERIGDARIAFLGELRLKRRQRVGVARPEDVFRRGETLLRIGVREGHRAHRAFDGAAQRVIDAHLLESGGFLGRNCLTGLGVEECPRRGFIGHDVIGGIDQQAIVAERFEDRRSLGRRFRREFADRCLGLGKLVVEKARQRIVQRVGAGGAGHEEKNEKTKSTENLQSSLTLGVTQGARQRHGSPFGFLIRRARPHPALRATFSRQAGEGRPPLPLGGRRGRGEGQLTVSRRTCRF